MEEKSKLPYSSLMVAKLADALRAAEKAHAEYEKRSVWKKETEKIEWPEFYADYLLNHWCFNA